MHEESPTHESSSTCPLQTLFPAPPTPEFLAAKNMLHTLLPHELKISSISEKTMIELTTQIKVSEGKHLNINKLSQEH